MQRFANLINQYFVQKKGTPKIVKLRKCIIYGGKKVIWNFMTAMLSKEEAEPENFGMGPCITGAKVSRAVKQLSSGRVDEIHPKLRKPLDVIRVSWWTRLCNIAWSLGTVPLEWQTGVVIPLFKKGDQRVCSKYQGIAILSFPGTVYSSC